MVEGHVSSGHGNTSIFAGKLPVGKSMEHRFAGSFDPMPSLFGSGQTAWYNQFVSSGPRLDDEDTHPLAIKLFGKLRSNQVLKNLRKQNETIAYRSDTHSKWFNACFEQVKQIVADTTQTHRGKATVAKMHNVVVNKPPGLSTYGIQIGTTNNGGHIVTKVASEGPAKDLLCESDYIIAANQKLAVDLSHDDILQLVAESHKLEFVTIHFTARTETNATKSITAAETSATKSNQASTPSEEQFVMLRPDNGKPKLPRQHTIYLDNISIPKSNALLKRIRPGQSQQPLPSMFTVPTLSKEQARMTLLGNKDGAYIFREARGKVVLSLSHVGDVKHYTLKVSLNSSYNEVNKALRKFVSHYSSKRNTKSKHGLPCRLTEYIMDVASDNHNTMFSDGDSDDDQLNLAVQQLKDEDVIPKETKTLEKTQPTKYEGFARKLTARKQKSGINLGRDFAAMGETLVDVDHDDLPVDEDGLPMGSFPMSQDAQEANDGDDEDDERQISFPNVVPSASVIAPEDILVVQATKPRPALESLEPPSGTSAVATSATSQALAEPAPAPRRRALVRGGNAKATPVLPEFKAAMDALDNLTAYLTDHLNEIEEEEASRPLVQPEISCILPASDISSGFSFKNLTRGGNGFSTSSLDSNFNSNSFAPSFSPPAQSYSAMMDTLF